MKLYASCLLKKNLWMKNRVGCPCSGIKFHVLLTSCSFYFLTKSYYTISQQWDIQNILLTCPIMWMQENWDRITKTFAASAILSDYVKSIVTLVSYICTFLFPNSVYVILIGPLLILVSWQFTSKEKEAEISQFFATRTKPGFKRALKQSLENVRISARWVDGIRGEAELAQTVHDLLIKLWFDASRIWCICCDANFRQSIHCHSSSLWEKHVGVCRQLEFK